MQTIAPNPLSNVLQAGAGEGPVPESSRHLRRLIALGLLSAPALIALWLIVPPAAPAHRLGIAVAAAVTCGLGIALVLAPVRAAQPAMRHVLLGGCTLMVSGLVYMAGPPGSGLGILYLWVTPYAYIVFGRRGAVWHTALLGGCFAVTLTALAERHDLALSAQVSRWTLVVGTAVFLGLLVRGLSLISRDSETLFRRGFDDSALGLALVDRDMRILEVNNSLCGMLGRPRDALVGRSAGEIDGAVLAAPGVAAARGSAVAERRCRRPDGSWVLLAVHFNVVNGFGSRGSYYFCQVEDITERRRDEAALSARARQQEAIAHFGQFALKEPSIGRVLDEAVAIVASTLRVDLCKILELEPDGERLTMVAGGGWPATADLTVVAGPASHARYTLHAGSPVVVEDFGTETRFTPAPLLSESGVVSALSVVIDGRDRPYGTLGADSLVRRTFSPDDVNFLSAVGNILSSAIERHRAELTHRHAALHDDLTGLPNRALVLDRIERALGRRGEGSRPTAVMMLDLDRFKLINDSFGHAGGDQLLLMLVPRLLGAVRRGDTVGRLGGDEFLIVCPELRDPAEVRAIAERLAAAVATPFSIGGGRHVVSASIGVALGEGSSDTAEALIRDADTAMYRAKEKGRGGYEIFDERLRQNVLRRLRTESELRHALDTGQLKVRYQPIFAPGDARPTSVEALLRWHHPERGLVAPEEFIPIAEESGLIADLGLWTLREACRQVGEWQRTFGHALRLCVNVSGRQLARHDFPELVQQIATETGLVHGTLGLEITESVLMEAEIEPVEMLARLRSRNLRLILDDFGTGYSSLGYLQRFDLDALKIDRSFVSGLGSDDGDSAIVTAIIQMADALGLDVVAEGVETPQQLARLRDLGCGYVQGFLLGRPMEAAGIAQMLARPAGDRRAVRAVA